MIRREPQPDGRVRLVFQLPADLMLGAVFVVGDFNDWEPGVTAFSGCENIRSATVDVEPGRRYAFRYLADGGRWFAYENCDGHDLARDGVANGVVDLAVPPSAVA